MSPADSFATLASGPRRSDKRTTTAKATATTTAPRARPTAIQMALSLRGK
jgi:hypothetical protein